MEVLNIAEPVTRSVKRQRIENEKLSFDQMWQTAISGEEFERRAHTHIKKLYALRDKQQTNC